MVRRRPLAYSFKHESLIVPEGVRGLDLLCVVLVSHGISRESIHLCFNVTVSVLPGQKEPRNDLWTRMKETRVRNCANVLVHKGLDEMDGTVHQETAGTFEGEKFREFCGFVAIRKTFLCKIWGRGILWRGKSEQSAKVFSLKFVIYEIFSLESSRYTLLVKT